jgi:hypothetical protein
LGILTLTNSILAYNTAHSSGGISNNGGTAMLTNCTLAHNTAHSKGGISNNEGTVMLTNCTLAYNTALGASSGGIGAAQGIVTVINSTLVYNTATDFGGGISIINGGSVSITNSTMAHNTAEVHGGGGVYNQEGALTVINSTLADNTTSRGAGGGIFNDFGLTTLQNTILARNTALGASPPSADCFGVVTSLGTNLIGNRAGCTITLQSSDREGDPGLNAFTTGDGAPGHGHFPLLQNSQAIDAGNDAACPTTDQLGQLRVGQCDIGAIEFQPSDTTPPTVTIVSVTPATLWPPNGKLVPVILVATIMDTGSGMDPSTPAYTVEDEYGSVEPRGSLTLRADGRYTATIPLQASRNGNDTDGRLYTIIVSANDTEGNEGSAEAIVTVPHNQGQSLAVR